MVLLECNKMFFNKEKIKNFSENDFNFLKIKIKTDYIEITLNTGDPALAINRVLDGHESMAIAARPSKLPAQIAFVDIGYSPLVLIAPTIQCPITEKLATNTETIDWSELEFIVAEQGFSRQRLEQWWRKNNVQGKIYAQVAGHEAMVSMVSLGLGVAMIPKIVLDNSPLNDKVQVLQYKGEPPQGFKIGLAVLHKELNDPAISALWNIAQNMGENII